MENEIDLEVEDEFESDFENNDTEGATEEDSTDWKAEALKQQAIAKRYKTKLEKAKEVEAKPETKEIDYGQKAYITSVLGVKGADEMALVNDYIANGKSLDDLADNKHFQNDLKDLREIKATKEATPSNTKRSAQVQSDTVEYWLAKGTLPPPEQQELRQKVVNAKYRNQKSANPFSSNPVVG